MWLTLIQNLGIIRYIGLINRFQTNRGIFHASKSELMQVEFINEKLCNDILDIQKRKMVKNYLKFMELNQIDIIGVSDKEYPEILREIYSPPICLYIRGNKEILKGVNVSMVGCRDCSDYGKKTAQKLAFDLVKQNINIISGLAKGIDEYSHLGAIYGKGKTIAVLGSGVDIIYPKENIYLAEKILQTGGAIISEYPIGTKPERMNFPLRNRIVSGLAKGIIVVEAKKKSGTLITVDFALDQGKDVFVVPRKY